MSEANAMQEWSDECNGGFDYHAWLDGECDQYTPPPTPVRKSKRKRKPAKPGNVKLDLPNFIVVAMRENTLSTTTLEMQCHCGEIYRAKVADLKRAWGLSCSRSCAAHRRERNLLPAKFYGL